MESQKIEYTKYVLPNGIRCVFYQRPEIHSVNISVEVNVGTLDEDSSTNGLSHLIEHLPFDGTKRFKDWEVVDAFNNNISGSSNAYTSYTSTRYYGYYPCQFLDDACLYLAELVLHPTLSDEFIKKEKDIVLDELKKKDDTIGQKIYENIVENRYVKSNTPFSFDIVGTEKNVKKFNKKEVLAYYKKYYIPENIQIFAVGNFEISKIKKVIKKYFYDEIKNTKYAKKSERSFEKKYPEYSGFNISAKQKTDIDQVYLTLNFPTSDFQNYTQEERILAPFLKSTTASSQYQQSVLWKKLREELGIVYDVSAWSYDYFNRAFLTLQISFGEKHLETVLKEVYKGINTIKENKISDIVFKTKQKRTIDTELMEYDYPSNVLNWIIDQEYEQEYHDRSMSPEEYVKLIKSYKFSQIIDLANKIYDWDKVNIGVVSKEKPGEMERKVGEIWKKITASK